MIGIDNIRLRDNVRYERKFFIEDLTFHDVEEILYSHPAMFSEIYQKRAVNNIYFDTKDRHSYSETVNGISNRLKVRIRWYQELFGKCDKPVLELKIKNGICGIKEGYALPSINIDGSLSIENIRRAIDNSDIPYHIKTELKYLDFALLNRYNRRYFLSSDNNFRVTIDTNCEAYQLSPFGNAFKQKFQDNKTVILEIKYDKEHEETIDSITNLFPFRVSKSSKFVQGSDQITRTL